MTRRLIAGLIVVGLAIGVWLLWPKSEPGTDTTTTALGVGSTTTSGPTTVPETSPDSTTTGTTLAVQNRDVETVEEAEAILRALWFGWFEGIYNQDEDRIKEVVASQQFLDDARAAFGQMTFVESPSPDLIDFSHVEVLRSDDACLVIWSESDLSQLLGNGAARSGVDVIRWFEDAWRMTTAWAFRDDLWEGDCEAQLDPLL